MFTVIIIPDKVTYICDHTFSYCYNITNLIIPNSVNSIGEYAFMFCPLVTLTIGSSVQEIGSNAFYHNNILNITILTPYMSMKQIVEYCGKKTLENVIIGNDVTVIDDSAFDSFQNIKMLIIGNKVEKIGYYAFRNCENLKCITIPNSVIKIGDYAIQRCYSLETLTIGCNVSMIGERSLESNSNLTNIAILSPYISIKLVVSSYKKTLTTVIIGNNVTTIDDDAFSGFYTLKEINIGNKVEIIGENVKSIDNYAFMLCTNLHCINYYGEVEPRYKDNAFYQTNIYKPLMQILTVRFPTEVNPIKRSMGPLAIIICPTRELCLQTYSVIHKMNSIINFIVAGILIGGEKVNTEKKRIRKGINILITTPSRFLYHLHNTQNFKSFPNLQFLVLDEADRLLDLGFFKPITEIIESLPPRQTILISATLTEDLKALTNLSLNDPITIGVHTENQKDFSIPPQLQQRYLLVDIRQRLVMLALLLRLEITNARRRHTGMKSIVFINTCDSVDFHYHFFSFFDFKTDAERGHVPRLQYNEMQKRNKQEATIIDIHSSTDNDEIGSYSPYLKCPIFRIHGNVEQIERSKTISKFTSEEFGVLFCTDVASRGLDIPNVTTIIQYDSPLDKEEYVHRIGRTARIGNEGISYIFLSENELSFIQSLQNSKVNIKEYKCKELIKKGVSAMKGNNEQKAINGMKQETMSTVEENDLSEMAKNAWQKTINAYATHKGELRNYFQKDKLDKGALLDSFCIKETPSEISNERKEMRKLMKRLKTPRQIIDETMLLLPENAYENKVSEFI